MCIAEPGSNEKCQYHLLSALSALWPSCSASCGVTSRIRHGQVRWCLLLAYPPILGRSAAVWTTTVLCPTQLSMPQGYRIMQGGRLERRKM